eukprot:UN04449
MQKRPMLKGNCCRFWSDFDIHGYKILAFRQHLLTKFFGGDYHALKSSSSKYHGREYSRTKDFPF